MNECVQYIVVRKDLIEKMGIGKTSAQIAHASLGAVVEKIMEEEGFSYVEKTQIIRSEDVDNWFNGLFTKIVVYVKAKTQLLNLAKKLDNDNIRIKLIYDNCSTKIDPEEENGTTLTCLGIIPINRNNVPKYLKKLQLLE